MSKIKVNDFMPKKDDNILIDTNVLIPLFYPTMSGNEMKDYENLYSNTIKNKANLIISSIQISEFINRCIRFQYKLYCQDNPDKDVEFKRDYRNTDDYNESMDSILEIVKNDIATSFAFIDDNFSKMKQDDIFLPGFSYDFNDAILVEIAKAQKAYLVTNDRDFANYSSKISIITNNKTLLMFSK